MPRLSVWFVRASLVYLVAGFSLGAVMLSLKALARPGTMAALLPSHVDFLLVGWTVQLVMGVAFWILPRFEGGVSRGAVGWAWLAFVLINAGAVLAGVGGLTRAGDVARFAGRAAEAAAALAFGLHAWRRVKRVSV